MKAAGQSLAALLASLRQGQRRRAGTVALEFALLASAFLALLMGVLELAVLLFAQIALDFAAAQSARCLFTGQVFNSNSASGGGEQAAIAAPAAPAAAVHSASRCSRPPISVAS